MKTKLSNAVSMCLMLALSLSGWVTSIYIFKETKKYQDELLEGKLINAFNILEHSIKDISSEHEIYQKIKEWHQHKKSAQLGSLKTVCTYAPEMIVLLSPIFCEKTAIRVCDVSFDL
ncbi:hypothetical protein [Vibrio lentus]|uniref:Uncharacterized protein n=1 Tax=Vibrio lentus TaxID=136468 RepID=A0A4U2EKS1_9VIBR|nr:hypothetical protein [Vibrio lentus]TKG01297.1 hypothetical protein FCV91_23805 [Vibrio lentus]